MKALSIGKALLAFAVLNFAVTNALVVLALRQPVVETDLHPIAWFFTGKQGGDSWRPMLMAHRFARTPEGRGKTLYEKTFFSPAVRHKGFQYPPTALLAVELSSLLVPGAPLRGLEWITWAFIPLTAWWCGSLLLAGLEREGILADADRRARLVLWLAAILLTLTFYPALRAYRNGQAQTWINGLFAGALLLFVRGSAGSSGALIGLMCAIKPQCGVALLWALLRRERAFATGFVISASAAGLASIAIFGWAPHVEYLRVLSYIAARGESFYPNQSFNGVLNRALGNGDNLSWMESMPPPHPLVYAGTLLGSVVLLGWALWPRARASSGARACDLSMVVLAATAASPIAWEHHYGVLLPIFALLLPPLLGSQPGRSALSLLALAYVLSSHTFRFTDRFADTGLSVLQAYIFAGALLTLTLLDQRRRRAVGGEATPAG